MWMIKNYGIIYGGCGIITVHRIASQIKINYSLTLNDIVQRIIS